MEINYIKEFVILSETQNFLEASESLFISQSTLTRHIKLLEDELGHTLFDRTTRKVSLNEFGKLYLPFAKEMVRIQYDSNTSIYNYLNNISGTVTLGTIPVISQYHIYDVMEKFRTENKNFHLNVIEADTKDLIDMLLENKCDFAFIREEDRISTNELLTKIHFASDHLAAIMNTNHTLANEALLELDQLKNQQLLMLPKGTMMHDLCLQECNKANFEPNITYTSYRGSNLIDMAARSNQIALLMKKTAKHIAQNKVSIIDITPTITTTIKLAYKKGRKMSPPNQHFLDCVKSL